MRSPCHHNAFTLIEMLTATALTTLLMLLVLAVIAGVGRSEAILAMQIRHDSWPPSLVQLVRWDLAHAAKVTAADIGFTLEGHGALDPATSSPNGQPAKVQYTVVSAGGRNWLIRRQTALYGDSGEGAWSEIICPDVQSIELAPADRAESDANARRSPREEIPDEVRLVVRSISANVRPLEVLICIRSAVR